MCWFSPVAAGWAACGATDDAWGVETGLCSRAGGRSAANAMAAATRASSDGGGSRAASMPSISTALGDKAEGIVLSGTSAAWQGEDIHVGEEGEAVSDCGGEGVGARKLAG